MTGPNRKVVLVIAVVALVGAGLIVGLYAYTQGRVASQAPSLPSGCVKPQGGFLLIASDDSYYGIGYNNSEGHGAPQSPWPIITVPVNSTVVITVCNVDVQAHSFNVIHYLEGAANTIAPGQVETFRFVADQTGTFSIYCNIFCSIHIYMQNGQLRVTG